MPQICAIGLARGAFSVFTVGESGYLEVSVAEQLEFSPSRARAGVFVRWMNADIAVDACVPVTSVSTGKTLATRKSRRYYASVDSAFCAKYAQTKRVRPKNPSNLHFFNTVIAYTHDITSLRKMLWFSELPLPPGARILPFCDGLLAPDGLEYVSAPAGELY